MAGWDNPMREFERLRIENAGLRAEVERLRAEVAEARADALREAAIATLGMTYPTSADPDVWGAWLHDRADRERP